MADATVAIAVHGFLDHARAETVAARIRAAVRNHRSRVAVVFDADAVIASECFLAFLLRTAAVLKRDGGSLELGGAAAVLEQLRALGLPVTAQGAPS